MSQVQLTGNFLATARCLIFADSASGVWSFNPNTNTLTITAAGGGTGSANPSVNVGLAVINGSAATWMRSDAAPALSQAIVPTWAGLHTFGAGLTVSGGSTTISGHVLTLTATASVGGTNTGDQVVPVSANPSATIGLSAVNGTAATWMTSDSAPVLSQAIVPTWTGAHTFHAAVQVAVSGIEFSVVSTGVGVGTTGADSSFQVVGAASSGLRIGYNSTAVNYYDATTHHFRTAATVGILDLVSTGSTFFGPVGVNSVSPPAKVTGWGTPTGQTVVNNFAAGAGTSVLQMSEAIAQIITDLKAFGIYGA